jgi:hypothetical protein
VKALGASESDSARSGESICVKNTRARAPDFGLGQELGKSRTPAQNPGRQKKHTRHRTCAASMTSRPAGMPMSLREDMVQTLEAGPDSDDQQV